jgi:hypothetical protein
MAATFTFNCPTLDATQLRIFRLPVCCLKTLRLNWNWKFTCFAWVWTVSQSQRGSQINGVWITFFCFIIRCSGRLLLTRWWTFGVHKRCEIPWHSKRLLNSRKQMCSVELVTISRVTVTWLTAIMFTAKCCHLLARWCITWSMLSCFFSLHAYLTYNRGCDSLTHTKRTVYATLSADNIWDEWHSVQGRCQLIMLCTVHSLRRTHFKTMPGTRESFSADGDRDLVPSG